MATTASSRVDELVQTVTLHNPRKLLFTGYVLPSVILHTVWIYSWIFVYGIDEYYDAGLVGIAAIGVLQIFICLCCQWSVHIHTFFNCSSVSWRLFIIRKYINLIIRTCIVQYVSLTWQPFEPAFYSDKSHGCLTGNFKLQKYKLF